MKSVDIANFGLPNVLGIDIRDHIVRIVQASGRSEISKVTRMTEHELPSGSIGDGVILRPRQVAALLRERLLIDSFEAVRCSFSIPSGHAVVAELTLPRMTPEELNDAARFRLKKSVPFSLDNAYVETLQLEGFEEDDQVATLAIATPKAIVDSRADTLAYAGLEPIAAETDAQSILRVIHRRASRLDSLERDSSITVVEIGDWQTSMYVIRQRKLQFLRTVKFGVRDLQEKLYAVRTVLADPETMIHPDGSIDFVYEGEHRHCSLQDELGRLVKEVGRLLRYFRSMHPERSYRGLLDTMLVCGDLASTNGFLSYFAEELGFRAELLKPLYEVNMGVHTRVRDFIDFNEAKFAIATGCLLLGIEEGEKSGGQDHGRQNKYRHAA